MNKFESTSRMFNQMHQSRFDKLGGVKLNLVYPADSEVQKQFRYYGLDGNIEAHLANFGQY